MLDGRVSRPTELSYNNATVPTGVPFQIQARMMALRPRIVRKPQGVNVGFGIGSPVTLAAALDGPRK